MPAAETAQGLEHFRMPIADSVCEVGFDWAKRKLEIDNDIDLKDEGLRLLIFEISD